MLNQNQPLDTANEHNLAQNTTNNKVLRKRNRVSIHLWPCNEMMKQMNHGDTGVLDRGVLRRYNVVNHYHLSGVLAWRGIVLKSLRCYLIFSETKFIRRACKRESLSSALPAQWEKWGKKSRQHKQRKSIEMVKQTSQGRQRAKSLGQAWEVTHVSCLD